MNTEKLHDALEELEGQRASIDSAITGLKRVIGQLEGTAVNGSGPTKQPATRRPLAPRRKTYVDFAEVELQAAGMPLHINDLYNALAETASAELGKQVTKQSLEGTLITHQAVKVRRVIRVGPSIWGLAGRDKPGEDKIGVTKDVE
jgi:hypothetical protein